jgi:hypothetical protein
MQTQTFDQDAYRLKVFNLSMEAKKTPLEPLSPVNEQPCPSTKKWGEMGGFDKLIDSLGTDSQGFFKRMLLNRPDFSRWNLAICWANGSDRNGYKCYPSYDWRPLNHNTQLQYDEENGLRMLLNMVIKLKLKEYHVATIFGAFTYGSLENSKKPHKETICVIRGGYVEKFPALIFNDYTDEKGYVRRRLNIKETLEKKAIGEQNKRMITEINSRIIRNNSAA